MILQNLSSQPLKQGRADQSFAIPAVSPTLSKSWVSLHHQDSSLPLIASHILPVLLHATGTNLCQLNRFPGHFWGAHMAVSLLKLTWGYLSWFRPLKINKRTEELSLVKWWDFGGKGKQQLPKALWTLSAEWGLFGGWTLSVNKQRGDIIWVLQTSMEEILRKT